MGDSGFGFHRHTVILSFSFQHCSRHRVKQRAERIKAPSFCEERQVLSGNIDSETKIFAQSA
jgi:hypothetical protein